MIFLALLLLTGEAQSPPSPWSLMVGVPDRGLMVWQRSPQHSESECTENLARVVFNAPRPVLAYCERDQTIT